MGEALLHFVMHLLTYMFFIGMTGSLIVALLVVISFSEELRDFFVGH
jgi:hypothetical protein